MGAHGISATLDGGVRADQILSLSEGVVDQAGHKLMWQLVGRRAGDRPPPDRTDRIPQWPEAEEVTH